jgi:hypothetical protein
MWLKSTTRLSIVPVLAMACLCQTDDYSSDKENVVLKTQPGKQFFPEDVRCGEYFWKSDKADKKGATVVYYFYGDPAYGKNKAGVYQQRLYRVFANEKKDPPTVQVIRDPDGGVASVKVLMTASQLQASRACFPE